MARNAGKGGLKEVTVNRIENEGQHDRIPFFDVEGMRALVCFRVASSSRKMVSSARPFFRLGDPRAAVKSAAGGVWNFFFFPELRLKGITLGVEKWIAATIAAVRRQNAFA